MPSHKSLSWHRGYAGDLQYFGNAAGSESAWRYIDLTEHAEYTAQMIQETLVVEMREEAEILKAHHDARESIKEIIEGPNESIDRIIRSIKTNRGLVGGKLKAEFPILENGELAARVKDLVDRYFPASGKYLDDSEA